MNKMLANAIVLLLIATPVLAWSATGISPEWKDKAKHAVDEGLHYLRASQSKEGLWSESVGITGLALRAFLESHRGYEEADGPFITKPVKALLKNVNEDGSISESNQNRNYNTAVAIVALQDTGNPAYAETIKNGQQFIKHLQLDETKEYDKDHKYYGGIGYGGDERPDLSNQYIALEALKATALDPKDDTWSKAMVFISRCQNRSESNDQSWAANDGGFTYMPGYSPHGGTGSYGSMTHAGLVSLLYANTDKSDPRIQAAYDWIRKNYSVTNNPGAKNSQGLFYYYMAMAKSLSAYGDNEIEDANGVKHNWRDDLVERLVSLQAKDGSWVNPESPRWWEGDKNLVTAYSVIALNIALQ